jgi:hypothetical protein
MIFGHKDWGVAAGSFAAIAGMGIFLYPNLVRGDVGTIAGYAVLCSANCFGIFSSSLAEKFSQSGKALLRHTLGRPRRVMGSALFLSRLSIIASAVALKEWTIAAPFVVWAAGDVALSLSREEAAKRPSQTLSAHVPA